VATQFTISGALSLPPDAGQPLASIPFNGAGSFSSKVDLELNLTGSGSKDVDLGSVEAPGAKCVLIEVDSNALSEPINVRFNGGSDTGQLEIAPGGFLAYSNPVPTGGITAITIVYTTDNRVRLRVLG